MSLRFWESNFAYYLHVSDLVKKPVSTLSTLRSTGNLVPEIFISRTLTGWNPQIQVTVELGECY